MDTCARCGHALGVGRFCTNCGQPTDVPPEGWHVGPATEPGTGTAEQPTAPPAPVEPVAAPPAVDPLPPVPAAGSPRFPLFADEASASAPAPDPVPAPRPGASRGARRWLPWAAAAGALLLLAVTALGLAGSRDDSRAASAGGHGRVVDAARSATATVPETAPPNRDVQGNLVSYRAANLLDGVPSTCWRMPGDARGREVVLHLGARTTLTGVGLVNGYAKTAVDSHGRHLDWYHGNRRVLRVQWVFDDGTTVTQSLQDVPRLQAVRIHPVTTRSVRVRLLEVSPAGAGPAGRDYTAIGDVSLPGRRA